MLDFIGTVVISAVMVGQHQWRHQHHTGCTGEPLESGRRLWFMGRTGALALPAIWLAARPSARIRRA